ncbi:MAG: dTMP kinase, partial [Deltaproteobacteria bacterium]
MAQGKIVVFEGIDQAGKATQTERLAALLEARGYATLRLAFPAYETPIGREIGAFLSGGVEIPLHVRHLLYAANRYEFKAQIERSVAEGTIVLIDRYSASGIVYGMAHGLPRGWLEALEAELPAPDFVFFLDLSPETARRRKRTARDRYERNLPLLATCRRLYREECERSAGWI